VDPTEAGKLIEAEFRQRVEHARSSHDRPVWMLMLGDPDGGLAAIGDVLADRSMEGGRGRAELAMVAGDWDVAAREARAALESYVPTLLPDFGHYTASLLALVSGDEAAARASLERLEAAVGRKSKLRSGHPAAVTGIPHGLIARDAAELTRAIDALLAWHLRRARAGSEIFNSAQAMISLEAVAALLLAQRRGLSVPIDPAYRTARLPILLVHVSEWRGAPLPRSLELSVTTDLVASAWLSRHGIALEPPHAPLSKTRERRASSRPSGDVDPEVVRRSLAERETRGGTPWQLASWALMQGDAQRARGHLWSAAEALGRSWRAGGGANHNEVRAHFALALVVGDEAAIRETTAVLQRWMGTPAAGPRYSHAAGYIDVVCDLVAGTPVGATAEQVGGPGSTRVAALAVAARDEVLLGRGIDEMLSDHARTLERKMSPPAPVSDVAATIAAAARRLGMEVRDGERYAHHAVPIELRNVAGFEGKVGRLECDLLGRALWGQKGPT
jgi:hypothetical protein